MALPQPAREMLARPPAPQRPPPAHMLAPSGGPWRGGMPSLPDRGPGAIHRNPPPPPPRLPTRVSAHSPACALPSQACPLVPCPAQLLSQVPETKGSVTTPAARASPGHRPRARLNYCWLLTNLAQRSPVHALDSLLHQRAAAPPAARCRVGTPRSCRRARLPAACHLCPCPYLALPRISRIRGGSQHAVGERMPRDLSSGPHL